VDVRALGERAQDRRAGDHERGIALFAEGYLMTVGWRSLPSTS
jgi:hypothetical protein